MSMFSGFTSQLSGWVANKTGGGQATAEDDINAQVRMIKFGLFIFGIYLNLVSFKWGEWGWKLGENGLNLMPWNFGNIWQAMLNPEIHSFESKKE